MRDFKLRGSVRAVFPALLAIVWIMSSAGLVQGQTLYEYIDKDGSVVITDSPPPGAKIKRAESEPPQSAEQKAAAEKEGGERTQRYREADTQRQEKQAAIRIARDELEKAKRDEQLYRMNMNQASGYAQRHHWRTLVDEQLKLIEEKQKKLDELESRP